MPRRMGLGRRQGGKRGCCQKKVSATSATAQSREAARRQQEAEAKQTEREERRKKLALHQSAETNYAAQYTSQLERAVDEKERAERLANASMVRIKTLERELRQQRQATRDAQRNAAVSKERSDNKLKRILEANKENVHSNKIARWRATNHAAETARTKAIRVEEEKVERLKQLKSVALSRARTAERKLANASERLKSRTEEKLHAELKYEELRDQVAGDEYADKIDDDGTAEQDNNVPHVSSSSSTSSLVTFKKVRSSTRGGSHTWPLRMLQIVLEMLVNGTPPSAVAPNIASFAANVMPSVEVHSLPSIRYVRNCRTILRIVGETLTAYRLANADQWEQLFHDGTSRRQVALYGLIISILEEADILPLVLSSAIILEDETSEKQCEAIIEAIERGGRRLARWAEVFERMFPSVKHSIPEAGAMNIGKLGRGGAVTNDTCNGARKTQRLLVDEVKAAAMNMDGDDPIEVLEVQCWHHLRNVWLGGMEKDLSRFLRKKLANELDEIDSRLRVSTSIESILRAVDKEFSLCANYPKGHGELFREWVEHNHPGALLLHVERASGSRQDLAVEGAGAVFWNRKYWVEFLDERLQTPGDNILQENLFIVLSSVEMIALARVCSVVHLSICLPTRWLAGNCHTLDAYNWSVRSMGRVADCLESALESIVSDPEKILSEEFMMGIFSDLMTELPPFQEYWQHIFEKKSTALVGQPREKVIPLARLRTALFSTGFEMNQETLSVALELGKTAATALLAELRDTSKATAEHLSSVRGRFSWGETSNSTHLAGMKKVAVNDAAERNFGGVTGELQCFGWIGLTNAAGIGQVRMNGDFSRGYEVRSKKRSVHQGIFHMLSAEMRDSLLTVASEDAPAERDFDRGALAKQRAAKRRKEELAKEHNIDIAREKYIDALYYHEMFLSQACWMTAVVVDRELKKLKSKAAKLNALKENIRMRVIGLGWKDLETPWSRNGTEFTPQYLTARLKDIIKEQRSRPIPEKPPVTLPQRKALPVLGQQASDVSALDANRIVDTEEFENRARTIRSEREAIGVGDRYAEMQPSSQPVVDETLIGTRLDVCVLYELEEGGTELRWSQGKVIRVSDGKNIVRPGKRTACFKAGEAVIIRWDANKERNEDASESAQRLLPSKWNPKGRHSDGCWRLDVGDRGN